MGSQYEKPSKDCGQVHLKPNYIRTPPIDDHESTDDDRFNEEKIVTTSDLGIDKVAHDLNPAIVGMIRSWQGDSELE